MDPARESVALSRFLLELAPAANGYRDLQALTQTLRATCAEMTLRDLPVRLLRSVFLPEDGTFLFVFDAASASAVEEAGRRAELPVRRISILLEPDATDQGPRAT